MVILLARPNDALLDLFSRKLTTAVALLYVSELYLLAFGLICHASHCFVFVQWLSVNLVKLLADVALCLISITVLAHEALHGYNYLSLLVRLFFVLICTVDNTTRCILALLQRTLLQLCRFSTFALRNDFLYWAWDNYTFLLGTHFVVNILTRPTTLQNRLSDGICSFFRVINKEEAYLTDVAIWKLLIRLILLKGSICTIRVLLCVQLEAGRILVLRAFYLELFNCMVITLLIIGLVEGFL